MIDGDITTERVMLRFPYEVLLTEPDSIGQTILQIWLFLSQYFTKEYNTLNKTEYRIWSNPNAKPNSLT